MAGSDPGGGSTGYRTHLVVTGTNASGTTTLTKNSTTSNLC